MRSVGLLRGRNLIEREDADKEKGRAQARPLGKLISTSSTALLS